MAGRKELAHKAKAAMIVVVFLALTALVVLKSGVVESNVFHDKPRFDQALLSSVAISGAVKSAALNLAPNEIKKLNYAALKHRNIFEKLNFHLNYGTRDGGSEVAKDTLLEMSVRLDVDGGGEITSWNTKVRRKDMVRDMVRYVDKAAAEYDRFMKIEGSKKTFKRLYI